MEFSRDDPSEQAHIFLGMAAPPIPVPYKFEALCKYPKIVPPVYPPAPNTAIDFLSRGVAADPRALLDAAMERTVLLWAVFFKEQPPKGEREVPPLLWAAFFEEQPPKGESAGENASASRDEKQSMEAAVNKAACLPRIQGARILWDAPILVEDDTLQQAMPLFHCFAVCAMADI